MPLASALARVIGELDHELLLYRTLFELLEEQYRVAANGDDAALARLCDALTGQLERLDARRKARDPNLLGIVALFSREDRSGNGKGSGGSAQPALQTRCRELKHLALACRSLCARNSELLASHYEALHRALHGEIHTYAPT